MGRTKEGGAYTTNEKQMKRYTLWMGMGCAACCWTATSAPALLRRAGKLLGSIKWLMQDVSVYSSSVCFLLASCCMKGHIVCTVAS